MRLTTLLYIFFIPLFIKANNERAIPDKGKITFTENKGQVRDQNYRPRKDVLFSGNANNTVFHLRETGISYQFNKIVSWEHDKRGSDTRKVSLISIYRVDMTWLNTNKIFVIKKEGESRDYNNYYLEGCDGPVTDVRSYSDIFYENIYNGVDVHYYEKNSKLKYDFIIKPGTDPKLICMEIKGAEKITIGKDGTLNIKTPYGTILEEAPLVFQGKQKIEAHWCCAGNRVSFKIAPYDKEKELIIDPGVRIWGTYYGDTGIDVGRSCATDAIGNVYMAGYTDCINTSIIATTGSHQVNYGGSYADAYIVKFNSAGARKWGTYYGGAGADEAYGCATDQGGNIYITGVTSTVGGTVIASAGSHQTAISGGAFDGFLAKLDSNGVRLWGTYYGGNLYEDINWCCTNAVGDIFIAGVTTSSIGIATPGSHQSNKAGGNSSYSAFLVKLNSSGVRQWGTYYGGVDFTRAYTCCADGLGNIYMAGETTETLTSSIISTNGSHQTTNGGGYDAFLTKFNSNGTRLWGTYYGGNNVECVYSCAVDQVNNVYITGGAGYETGAIIATNGSHQDTCGGSSDGFLVKFNSSGTRLWGTYYGGNGYDQGRACAIDALGNVSLSGYTQSTNSISIATPGTQQSTIGSGWPDAFIVLFDPTGVRKWATYYGSTEDDAAIASAVDPIGNIYIAGLTSSTLTSVMSTNGSQQVFFGGNQDGFLAKFCALNPASPLNSTAAFNQSICYNSQAVLTASGTPNLTWYSALTGGTFLASGATYTTLPLIANTTYYVQDSTFCGTSSRTAITVTVNSLPVIGCVTSNTLICAGQTVSLSASGASSYTWSNGSNAAAIVLSPSVTTTFTLTGISSAGCINTATFTQNVSACTSIP